MTEHIEGDEKMLMKELSLILPDKGVFIEIGSRDGNDHCKILTNKKLISF